MDEDGFDGEGGYFGEEDATKCVGDGSVDVKQVEGCIIRQILMKMDFENLSELLNRPGVVLARIMAWKVCRGHICDGFGIYTYCLRRLSVYLGAHERYRLRALTFRRLSSSADVRGAIWGVTLPCAHCCIGRSVKSFALHRIISVF